MPAPTIDKSTRHAKITGDFGEALVLYWLSKYGFECARVDHTGIDLIARNPHTDEVMGISVKSRCRTEGTEGSYLSLSNGDFDKAESACGAFGCVPWFAIVVDAGIRIRIFLLSKAHLLEVHPLGERRVAWKMGDADVAGYKVDPEIRMFEFDTRTLTRWEGDQVESAEEDEGEAADDPAQ